MTSLEAFGTHALTRPARLALSLLAGLSVLLGAPLAPASAEAGVTVVPPEEVLADWTVESGGRLFFRDLDGRLYELVTDIDDPVIVNKGTGSFHTQDPATVHAAVDAVDYPLDECEVHLFVLPWPRRSLLRSSATERSIVLSPGVVPYVPEQIHALVAHELGHIVHNQLMPESDTAAWDRYRNLRGITDLSVYRDDAPHKDRPREIFAEDFRVLFGGALANYASGIENRDIAHPHEIPGLRGFLLSLTGAVASARDLPGSRRLTLSPNPTPGAVDIRFGADGAEPTGEIVLSVFDVRGRLVSRTIAPAAAVLRWEGRLSDGGAAPAGMYFLRARRGGETWTGRVLVSR